ncbi:Uronate isomerase [Budvicia aquatica]|uniref:Uronate isomerase n=1 Tax=Budvicia aquatica TaxID=82979 RepID=A0A484ZNT9_9GAMM|nr:Uronate isomerase [Budvicia aquatica]
MALDVVVYGEADESTLDAILSRRLKGTLPTKEENCSVQNGQYYSFLASEYQRREWVQQYHIGALRNNNTRMFQTLGPDVGFDSINDQPVAEPLSRLLDAQAKNNSLPKTILYCLNPGDNETIGTMVGNFQGEGTPGKNAVWFRLVV